MSKGQIHRELREFYRDIQILIKLDNKTDIFIRLQDEST